MNFATLTFILTCLCTLSLATLGVDMSQAQCASATLSDWQCIVKSGYTFAIIEAWDGGYGQNPNIASCVANAWAAGMNHVDVYVFICPNCGGNNPASSAISGLISSLSSQGVNYGMMWFDIEQCSGCWNDAASNVAFIQDGVNAAVNAGVHIGMYSSEYEWSQTVGGSTAFNSYPLWYAHYDNNPSFSDSGAYQFGGWSRPAIKQYYDQGPCGVSVDVDYYP
eukprot:TRINITY_DN1697_c0_g1_i1.p1 TRINITY_DN1697_c0_g1~~TRINITY_DN1697_c0_g1_i1.p1  ORF type:complete len:222 (+),score=39.59 TRINITY_DN1697_c0_g1_i1:56-721(+)